MISVIVLTKNEEENVSECLKTLKWCDEIVVIDDYSTDRTAELAKKRGAKVFKRHLTDDFAGQRNFGLEKAKGEWVLFVDADERVTEAGAQEIKKQILKIKNGEVAGFLVRRCDFMWDRRLKHGEAGSVQLVRLGLKTAGIWKRAIHETWEVKGLKGTLKHPLFHYPHQTLREFIADIDFYSTLHAQENYKEGKRSDLFKIIYWPRLKFLQSWILAGGILDGSQGFMVAMMMSFHSFLAWSKMWLGHKNIRQTT